MPASPLHLTGSLRIEQGATYTLSANLKDQYGEPFDLTGFTGSAQLRHNYTDALPSASFTCSVDTPPTSGTLTFTLTASGTAGVEACNYKWDAEIASGSSIFRIFEGAAVVTPNVTR